MGPKNIELCSNGWGELIEIIQDGEKTSYQYRPDGLRHGKTTGNAAVTHLWDGQNMVAELNQNGSVRAKYLRGAGLIAQQIDSTLWYYQHNAHGDVIQRIRDNGEAAPQYRYDAFGVEQDPADTDPNPFRYCAEYYDAETKEYYLRARYYNPGNGRFTREDPARDSLNWYVYTRNNPINLIDPTGRTPDSILYGASAAIAAGTQAAGATSGVGLGILVVGLLYEIGKPYKVEEQEAYWEEKLLNDYLKLSEEAKEEEKKPSLSSEVTTPASPDPEDPKNKQSLKRFKNNKEANKAANKVGYEGDTPAEDLKEEHVGKQNISKFDMAYDTNTGEIVLVQKADSSILVPTGLSIW